MTRDRVPDPSQGAHCPVCGYEWAPVTTGDTVVLDFARHDVRHDVVTGHTYSGVDRIDAYRTLVALLTDALAAQRRDPWDEL